MLLTFYTLDVGNMSELSYLFNMILFYYTIINPLQSIYYMLISIKKSFVNKKNNFILQVKRRELKCQQNLLFRRIEMPTLQPCFSLYTALFMIFRFFKFRNRSTRHSLVVCQNKIKPTSEINLK